MVIRCPWLRCFHGDLLSLVTVFPWRFIALEEMCTCKSFFLHLGEDYAGDSIPASVTFAPLTTRRCFNITIVNDGVTERQEQFSVSFQREGRASADATAQIVIIDDDGTMERAHFQFAPVVVCDCFGHLKLKSASALLPIKQAQR